MSKGFNLLGKSNDPALNSCTDPTRKFILKSASKPVDRKTGGPDAEVPDDPVGYADKGGTPMNKTAARGLRLFWSALLLIASFDARADGNCPLDAWISNLPECPAGNNTILPAHYPNAAYVVSDDAHVATLAAQHFTTSTVLGILKNSGDQVPLILLPVRGETLERLRHEIRQFTSQHPEFASRREAWLSSLVQAGNASYTWQQDYFESFFDPATGRPVIRGIDVYAGHFPAALENTGNLVSSASKKCEGFGTNGSSLKSVGTYSNGAALYGGNIEGLPGGLCLYGDNQPREYARQYCGDDANHTVISSAWLRVGHVDEITALVKNPKEAPPCDFAITLASPRLALKLLKENPDEKFFGFYSEPAAGSIDLTYRTLEYIQSGTCRIVNESNLLEKMRDPGPRGAPANPEPVRGEAYKASSLERRLREFLWIPLSHAGVTQGANSGAPDCSKVTNAQIAKAFETVERIRINNALVQVKMDEARKILEAKLKERLPQCRPTFIEVPQLFNGSYPVEDPNAGPDAPLQKRYQLREKSLLSVLPNAANSVLVGNAVLSPHPQNAAFARYLEQAYQKSGLKSEFIDTYDYAHSGNGNLHCSTHSIPACKPRRSVK